MEAISRRAAVTLAPGSGHMIQWDRPSLVIDAVERVIAAAEGG
jgi:pimeloyl-ACP methyl ester carboxylesterase